MRGRDANGGKSVRRDFRVGEEMIVAEVVDLGSCAFQIPAGIADAGYSTHLTRRELEKFVQRIGGGDDWPG